MTNMKVFILAFAILAVITTQVNGHGAITGIQGLNGVKGYALGIEESTPRDCTRKNPCQKDTSIIRGAEVGSGKASACGRTLGGGMIDMESGVSKMIAQWGELPEIAPGSTVTLEVHQVNADGAGPFACQIDAQGTGENFQFLEVTRNVPGLLSLNPKGSVQNHPLEVSIPADINCSGGPNGNMCMIRCMNAAIAGPFGGCVPVQMGSTGAAKKQATTPPASSGGQNNGQNNGQNAPKKRRNND
ncbi:hypothetical protein BKA69DRAFT_3125 [Paraphysoderma sedebokerense]|nr:hypothetical protein BKA69DRAFT_3125 [Paraphysoderma sedebokerense]